MKKTAMQLVYEAFNECGVKGFHDWIESNKKALLEKERRQII